MAKEFPPLPARKPQPVLSTVPNASAGTRMEVACPHCNGRVRFQQSHAGQAAACPLCTKRFRLPQLPARQHATASSRAASAEAAESGGAFDFLSRQSATAAQPATAHQLSVKKKIQPWLIYAFATGAALLVLLAIASVMSGNRRGGAGSDLAGKSSDAFAASTRMLVNEYVSNPVAADQKYKSKRIELDLRDYLTSPEITQGPLGGMCATFQCTVGGTRIRCSFDADQTAQVAKLNTPAGEHGKIRGTCRGMVLEQIVLDKCELVFPTAEDFAAEKRKHDKDEREKQEHVKAVVRGLLTRLNDGPTFAWSADLHIGSPRPRFVGKNFEQLRQALANAVNSSDYSALHAFFMTDGNYDRLGEEMRKFIDGRFSRPLEVLVETDADLSDTYRVFCTAAEISEEHNWERHPDGKGWVFSIEQIALETFVIRSRRDSPSRDVSWDVMQSRESVREQERAADRKRELGEPVPNAKEVTRNAVKAAYDRLKAKYMK